MFVLRGKQKEQRTNVCLVDIEKILDNVARKLLGLAIRKKGMPEVLLRLVMSDDVREPRQE